MAINSVGGGGGGALPRYSMLCEAIPIFWHALTYIPKGVLENIRKKVFKFVDREERKWRYPSSKMEIYIKI